MEATSPDGSDERVRLVAVDDASAAVDATDVAALPTESVPFLERLFLRKLQRGDAKAFRELVRKHQDRIYSLCYRMLGDSAEAEDVAQEVFLAVHKHLPRFRGDCRLSTWLYRVAKNHCLNRIKYRERRETVDDSELNQVDSHQIDAGHISRPERPDQALLGAEERTRVHAALKQLSAEHRLLVVLRDIEGMSYEEIARIAELPAGTVKSRLHRARSALADLLAQAGMAPEGARWEE
jgi:RNA polymerase sigma-70 factor (ECF subfamily)